MARTSRAMVNHCGYCYLHRILRAALIALFDMSQEPQWLTIAREVRAIAQTGLAFTAGAFDHQRYQRLQQLAALLMAQGSSTEQEAILELLRQEKRYATPKG